MPEAVTPLSSLHHTAYEDDRLEDKEEDPMPAQMDDEVLEAELSTEAHLDVADACKTANYEAQGWRSLQCSHANDLMGRYPTRRRRKRLAGTEAAVDDACHLSMRLCKRRKPTLGGWAALLSTRTRPTTVKPPTHTRKAQRQPTLSPSCGQKKSATAVSLCNCL
jgi:hypothetical protein